MSEIIGRTIPVTSRATEKVSAVDSAVAIKRERPRDDEGAYDDQVDIAPQRHMAQSAEQITLSLQMVGALLAGELPAEAVAALEAFAPLGKVAAMDAPYQALLASGHEQIDWPPNTTLEQALYRAARM